MFDALGPLEGIRMWVHARGRLCGLNGAEWRLEPQAARCVDPFCRPPHDVPDIRCHCGYYAALDADGLPPLMNTEAIRDGRLVIGLAKGWGRAIPYTMGWRAEFTRPIGFYELTVPPEPLRSRTARVRGNRRSFPPAVGRYRGRSPLIDLARRWGVPLVVPPAGLRGPVWDLTLDVGKDFA